ncbi:hypothetical protein M0R72_18350, partial [Candidatus Pacearchaeota archaeon]|nr:hypothetical protein [Candidatus Pacearchaeota archaeon]
WHRVRTPRPKIFRKGNLLIGSENSQRVSDIVEYNLDLPEDSGKSPGGYLGSAFIPALRACLREHGGLKDEQMEAVIMIGYKGCLFIVGEDFTLSEIATPYEAIGAGAKYALGYLYAMEKTCLSPEKLIEGALGCAEYWCAGVRGPFNILEM